MSDPKNKTRNFIPYFVHTAIISAVLCMPLLMLSRTEFKVTVTDYLLLLILPVSVVLVFYVNYFILIDRLLLRKKLIPYIVCNLLLVSTLAFMHYIPVKPFRMGDSRLSHEMPARPMRDVPRPHDIKGRPLHPPKPQFITSDIILFLLAIGVSVAIKSTYYLHQAEIVRHELERSKSEAELQNLKAQLNPHFLFNALNNIYSFILSSPGKARKSTEDLCSLLRFTLYKSRNGTVPLSEEIDFLKAFISLTTSRFPEDADIRVTLPDKTSDIQIAPLLFQPIVENAFKYGMKAGHDSFVKVFIGEDRGTVSCRVENSLPRTLADKKPSGNPRTGIGIENLRKRLEIMYKGRYLLEYGIKENRYSTLLIIETANKL